MQLYLVLVSEVVSVPVVVVVCGERPRGSPVVVLSAALGGEVGELARVLGGLDGEGPLREEKRNIIFFQFRFNDFMLVCPILQDEVFF